MVALLHDEAISWTIGAPITYKGQVYRMKKEAKTSFTNTEVQNWASEHKSQKAEILIASKIIWVEWRYHHEKVLEKIFVMVLSFHTTACGCTEVPSYFLICSRPSFELLGL
jgi:hypothetical protein